MFIYQAGMCVADAIVLFLWNEFSLRKISLLRMLLTAWVVFSAVQHGGFSWMLVILVPLTALLWHFETVRSRLAPDAQNILNLESRSTAWSAGLAVVQTVWMFCILLLSYNEKQFLSEVIQSFAWTSYLWFSLALVPKDPPKRFEWKFLKKLLPLPQGA